MSFDCLGIDDVLYLKEVVESEIQKSLDEFGSIYDNNKAQYYFAGMKLQFLYEMESEINKRIIDTELRQHLY